MMLWTDAAHKDEELVPSVCRVLDDVAVVVPMPAQPPQTIGRYRITGTLGEGGMGIVYEAEQDNPRRPVALKILRPGITSATHLRRFEHETQILGRLHHPGIAQIFEAGTVETAAGTQPFFAMETVHGECLTVHAKERNLDTRQRLDLLASVCDAVEHAHKNGVIHRDLKPSNILVTSAGEPKVLDFGIARVTDADMKTTQPHTLAGQLVGTLPYMSPEQVEGDPNAADTRTDVYSLGVIGYELIAARLPHEPGNRPVVDAARHHGTRSS